MNNKLSPTTQSPTGADIRFQLNGPISFLRLGERKAVFSEQLQKIFELNDTAAYLASCIADRPTMSALLKNLQSQGLTTDLALNTTKGFITAWSRAKLLSAIVSTNKFQPCQNDMISVAGQHVALHYYSAALAHSISPVFAHLNTQTRRNADIYGVVASGSLAYVFQTNKPAQVVDPDQAAPALKGMLTDALFAHNGFDLALHCAMLVYRNQALLVAGPPGAGKTILTLALLKKGFEYGGDDITLLMSDGRVRGVPYAPALKPSSWKLVSQLGIQLSGSPIHRRIDGRRVRYAPLSKLAPQRPVRVKWIATLQRNASYAARLHPADTATTLKELINGAHTQSQRLNDRQLRALINMISRTNPEILYFSNVNEAVEVLGRKCEGG